MSSSSFPPSSNSWAKHIGVAITVVSAVAGVWARFSAMEERQENTNRAIVELRQELQRLSEKMSDRAMLERVHGIELQISSVKDRVVSLEERKRR